MIRGSGIACRNAVRSILLVSKVPPGDTEANKYLLRPYRKPWDLVKVG